MTGPEHYRQAEWLLEQCTTPSATSGYRALAHDAHPDVIVAAQAHATLALAAATAMGLNDLPAADWDQWRGVASAQ